MSSTTALCTADRLTLTIPSVSFPHYILDEVSACCPPAARSLSAVRRRPAAMLTCLVGNMYVGFVSMSLIMYMYGIVYRWVSGLQYDCPSRQFVHLEANLVQLVGAALAPA